MGVDHRRSDTPVPVASHYSSGGRKVVSSRCELCRSRLSVLKIRPPAPLRRIGKMAATITLLFATGSDGEDRRPGETRQSWRPMLVESPSADLLTESRR
jgi:hypothetical protein